MLPIGAAAAADVVAGHTEGVPRIQRADAAWTAPCPWMAAASAAHIPCVVVADHNRQTWDIGEAVACSLTHPYPSTHQDYTEAAAGPQNLPSSHSDLRLAPKHPREENS